jgi:CcmD family protein
MLDNGKILVVVAVLALILVGIFVFLVTIDRKVSRLEKEVEKKPESEK